MGRYDGFAELVAARRMALSRAALILTGDPAAAEHLLQEALTRAAQRWPRARASGDPSAFLRSVLVEVATRSGWRRFSSARTGTGSSGIGSAGVLARLAAMPAQARAVLYLRYLEDLDEAATGRLVGCSPATVRAVAADGLARLDGSDARPVPRTGRGS